MLFRSRQRALTVLDRAAGASVGHVFTVGHGYKILDDGFYVTPGPYPHYQLTSDQIGRFLVRAAASYIAVPLPWQMASRSEVAYLPEQMLWSLLLAGLPLGAAVAYRRDALVACLLVAYTVPTAVAVAVTTGNVGTLIRHRTLIVPYLAWVSIAGFVSLLGRAAHEEAPA